jgi:type IV pilus assembly protein PilV
MQTAKAAIVVVPGATIVSRSSPFVPRFEPLVGPRSRRTADVCRLAVMNMRSSRLQSGFTLVEVLVALVIFAFGMLGAVGMMLSSMQSTQYSSNSVVAGAMAREYGELMQMIPDGVSSTSSATATSTNTLMVDTDSFTGVANNCTGADKNCTPDALLTAARDDWALRVKSTGTLPEGAPRCAVIPRRATQRVSWNGAGAIKPERRC